LEILENPAAVSIAIEGIEDIVDLEVSDGGEHRLRVMQLKTRSEPGIWSPGEIATVVVEWSKLEDMPDRLEFVTDGHFGPGAVALRDALVRSGDDTASVEDLDVLQKYSLDRLDRGFYSRIRLISRTGDADSIYARASDQLSRLSQPSSLASPDFLDSYLDKLFRKFSFRAGQKDHQRRTFTKQELATLVDLDLEEIGRSTRWSVEIRTALLQQAAERSLDLPSTELNRQLIGSSDLDQVATKRRLLPFGKSETVEIARLLETAGSSLAGGAGSGKSTTLRIVARLAACQEIIPVSIAPSYYEQNTLSARIHRELERSAGRRLHPSALADALESSDLLLVIDGMTELPDEERNDLIRDLRVLKDRHPKLRMLVAGRDESILAGLDLRLFSISELTDQEQMAIAQAVTNSDFEARQFVTAAVKSLGSSAGVPLLFLMALRSLESSGEGNTRLELYEQFLGRMRLPSGGAVDMDTLSNLLAAPSVSLQTKGRVAAPKRWWLEGIQESLRRVASSPAFSGSELSAEKMFFDARKVGLLCARSDGMVGYLHDSFRDFLVGTSLRIGAQHLPESVGAEWEEAISFAAEAGALTSSDITKIADTNIVALSRVAKAELAIGAPLPCPSLAGLMETLVRRHLLGGLEWCGISSVGVVVAMLENEVLIAITSCGRQLDVDLVEFKRHVPLSYMSCGHQQKSGILNAALRVWLMLLGDALRSQLAPSRPRLAPKDIDSLRDVIVEAFDARREALKQLSATSSSMADRLCDRIAWTGLEGFLVTPGDTRSWRVEHSFTYRYRPGPSKVTIVDAQTAQLETASWTSWSTCTAEYFVEQPPSGVAAEALHAEAKRLLGID
jgi:hypothetical protein